jgi:hypothetical protein
MIQLNTHFHIAFIKETTLLVLFSYFCEKSHFSEQNIKETHFKYKDLIWNTISETRDNKYKALLLFKFFFASVPLIIH